MGEGVGEGIGVVGKVTLRISRKTERAEEPSPALDSADRAAS